MTYISKGGCGILATWRLMFRQADMMKEAFIYLSYHSSPQHILFPLFTQPLLVSIYIILSTCAVMYRAEKRNLYAVGSLTL